LFGGVEPGGHKAPDLDENPGGGEDDPELEGYLEVFEERLGGVELDHPRVESEFLHRDAVGCCEKADDDVAVVEADDRCQEEAQQRADHAAAELFEVVAEGHSRGGDGIGCGLLAGWHRLGGMYHIFALVPSQCGDRSSGWGGGRPTAGQPWALGWGCGGERIRRCGVSAARGWCEWLIRQAANQGGRRWSRSVVFFLCDSLVEHQHRFELVESGLEIADVGLLDRREREVFDRDGGGAGSVGDRRFEGGRVCSVDRGEVSHHAACEAVACAGWVFDGLSGEGRRDDDVVGRDEHRSVLALFDDDEAADVLEDGAACFDEVGLARQHSGFAIVEDDAVDALEGLEQIVAEVVDPEVHRVADDEFGRRQLAQELSLDGWVRVGEEDVVGVLQGVGDSRRGFGDDVEVGAEAFAFVPVLEILAVPTEGLGTCAGFEAGGVDCVAVEDLAECVGEIVADDAHESDGMNQAGGECEVNGRSAEDVVGSVLGCFDGVDADGSGDEQ